MICSVWKVYIWHQAGRPRFRSRHPKVRFAVIMLHDEQSKFVAASPRRWRRWSCGAGGSVEVRWFRPSAPSYWNSKLTSEWPKYRTRWLHSYFCASICGVYWEEAELSVTKFDPGSTHHREEQTWSVLLVYFGGSWKPWNPGPLIRSILASAIRCFDFVSNSSQVFCSVSSVLSAQGLGNRVSSHPTRWSAGGVCVCASTTCARVTFVFLHFSTTSTHQCPKWERYPGSVTKEKMSTILNFASDSWMKNSVSNFVCGSCATAVDVYQSLGRTKPRNSRQLHCILSFADVDLQKDFTDEEKADVYAYRVMIDEFLYWWVVWEVSLWWQPLLVFTIDWLLTNLPCFSGVESTSDSTPHPLLIWLQTMVYRDLLCGIFEEIFGTTFTVRAWADTRRKTSGGWCTNAWKHSLPNLVRGMCVRWNYTSDCSASVLFLVCSLKPSMKKVRQTSTVAAWQVGKQLWALF